MKLSTKLALVAVLMCMCGALLPSSFAADGAAVYKTKCAMCHGAEGQGKIGPALKGVGLSEEQIVALLTKGDEAKKPPHKKPVNGLSADDAKAVAEHVKGLK